jgi:predicted enzyme related to lactoylglutathione lyase
MNGMTKGSTIRYAHTNLVAKDWRRMVKFYCEVFGCIPVGGERDRKGPEVDALTGVKDTHVQGQHLRLPGHGDNGPTIEVFQFNKNEAAQSPTVMRPGFTHIAFVVPDVEAKRKEVHAWGGKDFSQLVTLDIPGEGKLIVIYVCDPEGNIIELQEWR